MMLSPAAAADWGWRVEEVVIISSPAASSRRQARWDRQSGHTKIEVRNFDSDTNFHIFRLFAIQALKQQVSTDNNLQWGTIFFRQTTKFQVEWGLETSLNVLMYWCENWVTLQRRWHRVCARYPASGDVMLGVLLCHRVIMSVVSRRREK